MSQELLKIENLTKRYDDNTVLQSINMTVRQGEVVVIIGPSGCGKSTFLRCINGLEPIQEGTISFEGELIDRKSKNIAEIRQKIGMVFQNYELFPHLTVMDNILLAPTKVQKRNKEEVKKEAEELLEKVGLSEKSNSYPRQLSGGQKQRVAIAGIIAMRPDCIVLDEPTAMLDPVGRKEVLKTIRRLNKDYGITIVLITHYMEEAAQADRVVVMDDGKIIMDDIPSNVFSQVDAMKKIGLDVPQVTELMYQLRKKDFDTDTHIINENDCVDALLKLLS